MSNLKLIPKTYGNGGSVSSLQLYIDFINKLEGWKTRCKALHWNSPQMNIHKTLDEFLDVLNDYEDTLAEGIMGAAGTQIPSSLIKGTNCNVTDALALISNVKSATTDFYTKIPDKPILAGVKSELETFIQNVNKYEYLFKLCL